MQSAIAGGLLTFLYGIANYLVNVFKNGDKLNVQKLAETVITGCIGGATAGVVGVPAEAVGATGAVIGITVKNLIKDPKVERVKSLVKTMLNKGAEQDYFIALGAKAKIEGVSVYRDVNGVFVDNDLVVSAKDLKDAGIGSN